MPFRPQGDKWITSPNSQGRHNCVTASAVRAISPKSQKASSGTGAGCNELLAAQEIPIIEKSDVRVRKRTEDPMLVNHILVRQAQRGYPRQQLTMVEVTLEGPGRKSDCG
ncbi:MAG: hypothetical protein ABI196_12280 [Bradyrhizobium sp.]